MAKRRERERVGCCFERSSIFGSWKKDARHWSENVSDWRDLHWGWRRIRKDYGCIAVTRRMLSSLFRGSRVSYSNCAPSCITTSRVVAF